MKLKENEQFHFGVYGICRRDGDVLLIKKSRGPYKGLYDLPGGRIEFGEKVEETLQREFEEEIGVPSLNEISFLGYNEYFCTFTNDVGEEKNFHHMGLYFSVECDTKAIKTDADGHDSLGALFVPITELGRNNCSQIALEMIQKHN
jgi:ADP-ribose pyrophosphatase YjhB (NUDIX family)